MVSYDDLDPLNVKRSSQRLGNGPQRPHRSVGFIPEFSLRKILLPIWSSPASRVISTADAIGSRLFHTSRSAETISLLPSTASSKTLIIPRQPMFRLKTEFSSIVVS